MRTLALLALAALLVAGCSQAPKPQGPQAVAPGRTTGDLHGVVVDDAIRPLANATVSVALPDGSALNATTATDGLFAFDGLSPGAYVVKANRTGYFDASVTATVSTTQDPATLRVVLSINALLQPAIDTYTFAGFLDCSVTAVAARAACDANDATSPLCTPPVNLCDTGPGNLTQDQFMALHQIGRAGMSFLQSEMSWSSSSGSLSQNLRAIPGARGEADGKIGDYMPFEGPSPLVMPMPGPIAQALLLGNGRDYIVRVFAGYDPSTAPPCVVQPPTGCPWGVGLAAQQRFNLVTHVFYNMVPPDGWVFSRDGLPPFPS